MRPFRFFEAFLVYFKKGKIREGIKVVEEDGSCFMLDGGPRVSSPSLEIGWREDGVCVEHTRKILSSSDFVTHPIPSLFLSSVSLRNKFYDLAFALLFSRKKKNRPLACRIRVNTPSLASLGSERAIE